MNLKGLHILVTGGAGFIGSHIVESLIKNEAKVRIIDNFSTGSLENLKGIIGKVDIIEGDILNYNLLLKACKDIDVISHQAAQLEIITCMQDPIFDLKSNTEASLNVFNAAVKSNVKKIIYASSACIYGQAEYIPQDEEHPNKPNWPYGVSKLAVEKYSKIYSNYYKIPMIGLRYGITYGPREWYGRVLTIFLKRALEKKLPVVWGGEQLRDFIYVSDAVDLHNLCIKNNDLVNEIFNVSTGIGTSIKDLAEIVIKTLNLEGSPIFEDLDEGKISKEVEGRPRLPLELKRMVLDNKKAKKILKWEPKIKLKEGIIKEFEWLKNNITRWKNISI